MATTQRRPATESIRVDGFLDLRGMANPKPIQELAQAAQSWNDGETVRALSDDECFAADFIRWAGGTDLQVLSLRYPTKNLTEVILRRPASSAWP